jgi:hypothetical protein
MLPDSGAMNSITYNSHNKLGKINEGSFRFSTNSVKAGSAKEPVDSSALTAIDLPGALASACGSAADDYGDRC